MPVQRSKNLLIYEGCNFFKYRLLLSILSGKSVKIVNIRADNDNPGLREYEINLIRLLTKMTNGTTSKVGETGTNLDFTPGMLEGGQIEHDCNLQRGIGYYLEAIMALAPFCKKPVDIKLRGITNGTLDPCVDRIEETGLPVLKRFVIPADEVVLKINKRGAAPLGGGEIQFKCPININLKTVQIQNSGMVKRIRGIACSLKVSPSISNRLVESAKGVLLNFIPDIYIHTDNRKGKLAGQSPGFGITLKAETTTGVFFGAESFSPLTTTGSLPCVPEDLGKEAAMKLLDEIHRNGCVDSPFQILTALFMALGKNDVSKVLMGPLTQATIQFLRDLKDFFGVVFHLQPAKDEEEDIVLEQVWMTCVGIGYSNLSKRKL